MFSRKILLALGVTASASAFAPATPGLRVSASKVVSAKSNAAARRPTAVSTNPWTETLCTWGIHVVIM